MKEIDFIIDVGQHILTCTHPHYKAIYENSPYQFNFKKSGNRENTLYKNYIESFKEDAKKLNCKDEDINFFINSIHPNCKNYQLDNLGFSPTHPFFGPDKYIVNLEHYSSLFTYLYINANKDTSEVDIYNTSWTDLMNAALLQSSFCGVLSHMHNTIDTFKLLARDNRSLYDKFIYFPLASPESHQDKQPKVYQDRFNVLFSNSFGGQLPNFRLRGGQESFKVILNLIDAYPSLYFTTIGPCPRINHPKIRQYPHIDDDSFNQIINETHVLLIPAMRVHTISLVKALCNGIIPIVSDGWGFDEYILNYYNGLVCNGQFGYTSWVNENNILVEAYGNNAGSKLIINIEEKLRYLLDNKDIYNKMSENCIKYAKENFNLDKRNLILQEIVDKNA